MGGVAVSSWKIYEWGDGFRVDMIHVPNHRPKFMVVPSRKPSRMRDFALFTPEPGPPIHLLLRLGESVNLHFRDEKRSWDYLQQERRLAGFALDLGIVKNVFFEGLFETGDWEDPSLVRYPKFVPDERFERRIEEAMEMWDSCSSWPKHQKKSKNRNFLGCVHGMQMEVNHHQMLLSWDVNGSGRRRTISSYRQYTPKAGEARQTPKVQNAHPDLERVTERLVDMMLQSEGLVLPESSRQAWEEENVLKGKFLIPSPEEVEVFRILEEPLPFFWGDEALVQWLEGQTKT